MASNSGILPWSNLPTHFTLVMFIYFISLILYSVYESSTRNVYDI